jgi:hypothetical protein
MNDEIIFKTAVDRNGEKLGRLIRVDNLPGKTVKKDIPYAIIHVIKPLRRDVKIPVELSKMLKKDGDFVWFDVDKDAFFVEVRKQRAVLKLKRKTKSTFKKFPWYTAK